MIFFALQMKLDLCMLKSSSGGDVHPKKIRWLTNWLINQKIIDWSINETMIWAWLICTFAAFLQKNCLSWSMHNYTWVTSFIQSINIARRSALPWSYDHFIFDQLTSCFWSANLWSDDQQMSSSYHFCLSDGVW